MSIDIAWKQKFGLVSESSVIKDNRIKNIWKETLFSAWDAFLVNGVGIYWRVC